MTLSRTCTEEFAGIFPHTDEATLEAIAERLRILVVHSRVSTGSGESTVTVSSHDTIAARCRSHREKRLTSLEE